MKTKRIGVHLIFRLAIVGSLFFVTFVTSESVYADAPVTRGQIPTVSDPGLFQKRLEGSFSPQTNLSPASISAPPTPAPKTPSTAEKIHFKLTRVIIKGNTALSDAELSSIFASSLHKTISVAELQKLVGDVTAKYRSAGYILSRAILPPQTIKGGVVTVQIIEGFISEVKVKGNPGKTQCVLEQYGKQISHSRPLQFSLLERNMLLMNDIPGFSVKSVLTPSKNIPAGADLTLVTERQRFSGYLSYDNYGTRYLGPQEFTLGLNAYSFLTPGDNNSFQATKTTQGREMTFAQYIHSELLSLSGTKLSIGGNYSRTIPGFTLEPLDVVGRSKLVFADLSYPMIRGRDKNFIVHSTFNYQNVISTILNSPFYADRLRTLVIGGSFDRIDTWNGMNSITLDLEHGFDILGANQHVNQSRPNGLPNFTKIDMAFTRLQGLTPRFSLYGVIRGQYSMNPLLATEQYGVGGPDIGRGYDPSEIVGDDGLSGKLEVRMQTIPELRFLNAVQYYVFYDAGEIWNRDAASLPPKQSLMSVGVGANIAFVKNLSATVFLAKPLTRSVATLVAMNEYPKPIEGFFQITASF